MDSTCRDLGVLASGWVQIVQRLGGKEVGV